MLKTLKLSFKNFFAAGKRNLLAVLTVILGSLAISAVFTINENINEYVEQLMQKSGGPNIFVYSDNVNFKFDQADFNDLESMTGAHYLVPDMKTDLFLVNNKKPISVTGVMFEKNFKKARPVKLIKGSFLSDFDIQGNSINVVISPSLEYKLGFQNSIGKEIKLSQNGSLIINLKIIGVAKALYENDDRGTVWLPTNVFKSLANFSFINSTIVGFQKLDKLDDAEVAIQSLLGTKYGNNIQTYNPKGYYLEIRQEYSTFISAGAIIGILALLGGTVGVMNLMLMTIRLRTKEIGLYKALGFSTSVVLSIFFFEAVMILALGGIIGSGLGCLVGYAIASNIDGVNPFIYEPAFVFGFVSSLLSGFIFSYFPARKASRMDVVEALRS